jgi:hypothetical protein
MGAKMRPDAVTRPKRPRDLTPLPVFWGRWDVSCRQVLQNVLEDTSRRTGWQVVRVGVGTLRPTGEVTYVAGGARPSQTQRINDFLSGGRGSACRPMVAASSGGGGISADPPAECPVRHSMRPRPARSVPAPFQDDLDAASLIFPVPSGDCPGYPSSWSPVRPKYAGWLCSSRSSVRGSDLKPWRYVRHASRRARARTRVRQCAVFAFRCAVLATSAAACSLAPLRKGLGDVPGTPCNSVGVIFPKLPAMFLKLLASCASLGSAN